MPAPVMVSPMETNPFRAQYILIEFTSSLDQPRPLDAGFTDAPGVGETQHHATIAPAMVCVPHSLDVENIFPSTEEDPSVIMDKRLRAVRTYYYRVEI